MRIIGTAAIAIAGGGIAALLLSAPAVADPGMPPCGGLLSQICNMVPMMPELDHDIDLTQNMPAAPNADELPPADVCAVACI
ncbi:MAG: fibronectin-binding protein [Mycobacterium sp.]|nr:fibronectin-binding protein [Mycobacterium sp.]